MKKISPNKFEYYKQYASWKPLEAAFISSGFETPLIINQNEIEQVRDIYEASIKAVQDNKVKTHKVEVVSEHSIEFYKKYCWDFFREDENYKSGWLKCFNGIDYIKWLIDDGIIKIPANLRIKHNKRRGFLWKTGPFYCMKRESDYAYESLRVDHICDACITWQCPHSDAQKPVITNAQKPANLDSTPVFPLGSIEFGKQVWPELKLIHNSMQTKIGGAGFNEFLESARMDNALSYIDANPALFPIVYSRKKRVIKKEFFKIANGKNWWIKAKILQRLLMEKDFGKVNYQKFYEAVKKTIK